MSRHSAWQRVEIGDVVRSVSESVADPVATGIERAVGLEHLQPGRLEIATWASTGDGLTFTRRFRAGQVLFGRRRVYQRKTAVPDFDGVCSGDIYVLEPSSERLLRELLPFIVQSEPFYQHALRHSAGSLSPRAKWTDLKKFEFHLPPIDEPRKIAKVLLAADRLRRHCSRLLERLVNVQTTFVDDAVGAGQDAPLGDLLEGCQYGLSIAATRDGTVPILRMSNVTDGGIDLADLKYVNVSRAEIESFRLNDCDVLFNRTNSVEHVGRTGLYRGTGDVVFASYLIRLKPKSGLLPEYLNLFLNSSLGKRRVRAHLSKGVSQANISGRSLKLTRMPLPSLGEQEAIVERASELSRVIGTAQAQVERCTELCRSLVTERLNA